MLSDEQQELIRFRGLATMHDYRAMSPANGEPFLDDGMIGYFDGRLLLLCGEPLRGFAPPSPAFVRALARRWMGRMDSIMYVGREPVSFRELLQNGFVIQGVHPRIARSAELFLEVNDTGSRHARVYRRATRNGFVARCRTGGILEAEHMRLIETFYRGRLLTPYLAELAISLPVLLTSPDTSLIEAWEHGSMRGFVAVHEPFEGISVALFLTHDGKTRGVSDFLYAQLLEHAASVGSTAVNVGPSVTAGHFAFKRKWRAVPLVPPYYAVVLRRRGRPVAARSTWLLRILGRVA